MHQVSGKMGIQVESPSMIQMRDEQATTIVRELRGQIVGKNPDIVVVILSSNRNDRYAAIKK